MAETPTSNRLIEEAERQMGEVRELVASLDAHQAAWRPDAESWSTAQCLAHLATSTRTFANRAEQGLDESGVRRQGPGSKLAPIGRGPLFGRFFRWTMEPPPKPRVPTLEDFEPPSEPPLDEALDEFLQAHRRLIESMRRTQGLDIARMRVPSVPMPRLRWSVGQCYEIALAHTRRHIAQIRRLQGHPGFPSVPKT